MDPVDLSSPVGGSDGLDGAPSPAALPAKAPPPPATSNVDLDDSASQCSSTTRNDGTLLVDISDALSERTWVKFTVHTRTSLPDYARPESSVVRLHEEFLWLHDTFVENREYEGFIIPPAPPRPDFDASREKLRRLGDAEGNLTKEEFNQMKQELEAEYLATFKKTVAVHEAFLARLAAHPVFRLDSNLRVFLEYEQELSVRGKNKKERLAGFLSSFQKQGDELLLSNTMREVDDYFEREKHFLVEYHAQLKDCTVKSDKMTSHHKSLADTYIKISQGLIELGKLDESNAATAASNGEAPPSDAAEQLTPFLFKVADALEKMRRIEGRVASDQDLKLSDTLRYHMRDSAAAKDLLYRRLRCLANYEAANKALDKARTRNRDVPQCEAAQSEACARFEAISAKAKEELNSLKKRRARAFQKSLTELAELELKHARAHAQMLRNTLEALNSDQADGGGKTEEEARGARMDAPPAS